MLLLNIACALYYNPPFIARHKKHDSAEKLSCLGSVSIKPAHKKNSRNKTLPTFHFSGTSYICARESCGSSCAEAQKLKKEMFCTTALSDTQLTAFNTTEREKKRLYHNAGAQARSSRVTQGCQVCGKIATYRKTDSKPFYKSAQSSLNPNELIVMCSKTT